MFRFLFAILLCLSFLSGCGGQEFIEYKPATPVKERKILWREYSDAAFIISKATKRPVLLHFSLEGCFGCKLMKQETLSDLEIVYFINENFIPIAINFDQDVLDKYKVEDFPTTLVISSANRNEIVRVDRAIDSKELMIYLKVAVRINALTERMDISDLLEILNIGDLDFGPL